MVLDTVFGIPLLAYVGVLLAPFFILTAISSSWFKQPRLMRYHKPAGRITVGIALVHIALDLLAMLFGIFI